MKIGSTTFANTLGGVLAPFRMLILLGVLILCGGGCVPLERDEFPTLTPVPSETPTPVLSPTPTVIWFPPTETPTPFPSPTVAPTLDPLEGVGALIFEDDFTTVDAWPLFSTTRGSVSIENQEITIAIIDPGAYISAVRAAPQFGNFYAEITAATSLCTDFDEYGVLFRAASADDFYRFSLSCNGNTRLDRIVGGRASSPQPWIFSSAVPPGTQTEVRLGVWVSGKEMRFFVDGFYLFTVNDPLLTGGNIGVFARSSGDNAVTVRFSDLEIFTLNR